MSTLCLFVVQILFRPAHCIVNLSNIFRHDHAFGELDAVPFQFSVESASMEAVFLGDLLKKEKLEDPVIQAYFLYNGYSTFIRS